MFGGMPNGVMDAAGGPMISGDWMNIRTGEKVTVRDSYIDGEDMVVLLTNGRQLSLDQFQDYVQMSEEEYDEKGNLIGKAEAKPAQPKPAGPKLDEALIFDGMEQTVSRDATVPESKDEPEVTTADTYTSGEQAYADWDAVRNHDAEQIEQLSKKNKLQSEEDKMLETLFKKTAYPKINVIFDWKGCPFEELKMLSNIYDIKPEDIASHITCRLMRAQGKELRDSLHEAVVEVMTEKLK